jgi:hypothetical protein
VNLGLISGQQTRYYLTFPKEAGSIVEKIVNKKL